MKTRYFLCGFDYIRKLSKDRLYWYYPPLEMWMDLFAINIPEVLKHYTEITEEEAFRHMLEN